MNNKRILKSISVFLLFIFLTEIVVPPVYALTSGPTQPEVFGNQPTESSENVSMVTGGFNYSIPVTSIPEYPMAIGYSSGLGMDQEASAFGYGFNGFSGAIGRNMNGIPDDLNGGLLKYYNYNQKNWNASLTVSIGAGVNLGGGAGIGASVSLMGGYDNYTGAFGAITIAVAAGFNSGGTSIGVGIGLNSDSRYGASASWSIGVSILAQGSNGQYGGLGLGVGSQLGSPSTLSASISVFDQPTASFSLAGDNHSGISSSALQMLSPLASISSTTKVVSVGMEIGTIIPLGATGLFVGGGASYFTATYADDKMDKNSYGFMHMSNLSKLDRQNRNHITDFTIEGENAFSDEDRTNPSYLQKDYFVANCGGLSGSMQLASDEHVVVSRNYQRSNELNATLMSVKQKRKEVERWDRIKKAGVNRDFDVLSLFKKKESVDSKDFDKSMFNEEEIVGTEFDKMTRRPSLRFRGDMAGEFNMSSNNYQDDEPNKHWLDPVFNSTARKVTLTTVERQMPLYMPRVSSADAFDKGNGIARSSKIDYYTVDEVLKGTSAQGGSTCSLPTYDPNNASSPCPDYAKFSECYYSHYSYNQNVNKSVLSPMSESKDKKKLFNIVNHLSSLNSQTNASNPYFKDLIADIRVRKTDGSTYIFNLPAFAKRSKSIQLTGKGVNPPVIDANTYRSFKEGNKFRDRFKTETEEDFMYPYAWMLTAIIGSDYIDLDNIPGPSDGDLGYWVKFKYVKTSDNYTWRSPFKGMDHMSNALHVYSDDSYMASSGTKEVYYLERIESKSHVSKYNYDERQDGVSAKGYVNGEAKNTAKDPGLTNSTAYLGDQFLFAVKSIDLYKKYAQQNNSKIAAVPNQAEMYGKKQSSTAFYYDYSICPNTPNNIKACKQDVNLKSINYYSPELSSHTLDKQTGKLTLRKVVQIEYDEQGTEHVLPSTQLFYAHHLAATADEVKEFNPEYDNRQVDMWGNYCKGAKSIEGKEGISFYSNYTEISKKYADKNAQAFTLKKINLPSGGTMEINYEANGYGSVQDKKPYVMRRCKNVSGTDVTTEGIATIDVKVDVTDIVEQHTRLQSVITNGRVSLPPINDNITTPTLTTLPTNDVIKAGLSTYMEFGFYQNPQKEDVNNLYLSTGYQTIQAIKDNSLYYDKDDARHYVTVTLGAKDVNIGDNSNPVFQQAINYAYGPESVQMKMIKEISNCNDPDALEKLSAKYKSMEKDNAWDAVKKVVKNVGNMFSSKPKDVRDYNGCFGLPGRLFLDQYSYIRTNIIKEKYTGTRVKSIKMSDNFAYASNTLAGTDNANEYITNYFYDSNYNGTGTSEGVSTIEPGGGEASVININNVLGAGFFPAPSICNSKVAVENNNMLTINQSSVVGDKISRNKGKTVYQFYTCKDDGLRFEENFKRDPAQKIASANGKFDMIGLTLWKKIKIFKRKIRIPYGWLPYFIFWKRADNYQTGAYSYTDISDMYGKPKKIERIPANGKEPVYVQEYNYFTKNEGVSVLRNKNHEEVSIGKPGRFDQTWSEANFSKEGELNRYNLMPIFYFANSKRKFNYTNMKQTYIPPLMKEVISKTGEGITEKVSYSNFDGITGMPLETKTTDSQGNVKISRNTPAYWSKPEMGEAEETVLYNSSSTKSNLMDASSASYVYLNDAGQEGENLLSASVTFWTKAAWAYAPAVLPLLTSYDAQNNKIVVYKDYSSNQLTNLIDKHIIDWSSKTFSKGSYYNNILPVLKPVSSYIYQTQLNTDGTFNTASLFDHTKQEQSDTKWKETSRATMFHANGQAVESKDILDKYASSHVGYSGMNSHYSVVNGAYNTSIYDGAENAYKILDKTEFPVFIQATEDNSPRFDLGMASIGSVTEKGEGTTTNFTLDGTKLAQGGASVFSVCLLDATKPLWNKPFAKIRTTLKVSPNTSLNRTLLISINENSELRIITDQGEPFTGFYLVKGSCQGGVKYNFIFDNAVIDIAATDAITTTYDYTFNKNVVPASCPGNSFTYALPKGDFIPEAHTGKGVFLLKANSKGTTSTIMVGDLPNSSEFLRKYKAMVWVYAGSPVQTKLVLQSSPTNIMVATMDKPYMISGNWLLLRAEIEAPTLGDGSIKAWVENNSSGIAIYDDFCVLPYQAEMNAMIYDQTQGKLVAKLNKDHLATYYLYDGRGRVEEIKTELVNKGATTVKKYLYNDQKKDLK